MPPRTREYWIQKGLDFFYQTGDWPKAKDFGNNGSLIRLFGKWNDFVDAIKAEFLKADQSHMDSYFYEAIGAEFDRNASRTDINNPKTFALTPEEMAPEPELPPLIEIHIPSSPREHLFIPDTQHREGLPTNHLTAVGNYAVERRPHVIVFAGDVADMTSLSSYDTAARKQRMAVSVESDFRAYHEAIDAVLRPIRAVPGYEPRVVITLGNHDGYIGARRQRYAENHPELAESVHWARTQRSDAEVYDFLQPITIDGVSYCHYFNVNSNGCVTRSGNGQSSARAQVQNVGMSCTAGHKQGLDVHVKETSHGRRRGLIAGSFYQHDEEYLSPQGNTHWRGCIYKHEVHDGDYDLLELSLGFLLSKYA